MLVVLFDPSVGAFAIRNTMSLLDSPCNPIDRDEYQSQKLSERQSMTDNDARRVRGYDFN